VAFAGANSGERIKTSPAHLVAHRNRSKSLTNVERRTLRGAEAQEYNTTSCHPRGAADDMYEIRLR
jgi:hypothetical protein